MKKLLMLFGMILLWASQTLGQAVTGTVMDNDSGDSLPGVNIKVKGTTTGTSTNSNGDYTLTVPSLQDTLVFSFVGFQTQEISIKGRTTINIQMAEQTLLGEEMVVVGYGTQEKVSLTSSVSEVKGEEIMARPLSTIQQALQGKVSGLTILDRGGGPTSSNTQMVLRGANTLYTPAGLGAGSTPSVGSNEPLVLVNGVEQPFQNINPDNIKSISVLKDASSTAIYGSRAANGVILITTKGASEGFSVSYNGYYGLQQATSKPEHMALEPYMRLQNIAYQNVGGDPEFTEAQIQEYVNGSRIEYPLPYDWYNVMYDVAPQVSHSLTLSGGTEDFKTRSLSDFPDII